MGRLEKEGVLTKRGEINEPSRSKSRLVSLLHRVSARNDLARTGPKAPPPPALEALGCFIKVAILRERERERETRGLEYVH